MSNKGNLYLIPTAIAAGESDDVLTPQVKRHLPSIRHFLAENVRTARRYLSALKLYDSIESLSFAVLDKDTDPRDLEALMAPVFQGHHVGVMSESGCPGIADPGALAVRYAHSRGIRVIPLVGPSSLFLALMASGLNGQRFAFQGYLPIDAQEAARVIRDLEKESKAKGQTQIIIETPYRNGQLLTRLLKNLRDDTELCVAFDITGPEESIVTQRVSRWKTQKHVFGKKPAVFLFLAG